MVFIKHKTYKIITVKLSVKCSLYGQVQNVQYIILQGHMVDSLRETVDGMVFKFKKEILLSLVFYELPLNREKVRDG